MGGSRHHRRLSLGTELSGIIGGKAEKVGGKLVQRTVSFFTSMSFRFRLIKFLCLVTHGSLRPPPGACGGDKVVDLMGARCLLIIIIIANTFRIHCLKSSTYNSLNLLTHWGKSHSSPILSRRK